jgi:CoA:oxalate CoA-transferase
MVAQAYSGLMSVTGPIDGEPCRVGTSVGDIVAGHQAAIAILSALWYRKATGKGQYIDISMVDGLVYILENAVTRYTIDGEIPAAMGTAHPTITPFQSFKTKDAYIIAPIGNDKLWKGFCKAINREDLTESEMYLTNQSRTNNRDALLEIVEPIMLQKTSEEWIELFELNKLPYSPINTIDQVVNDEQINYRKMIVEIDQPKVGKMKILGSPFNMSETPGVVSTPAPLLGEHTDEVLKSLLNFDQEKLDALRKKEIIK